MSPLTLYLIAVIVILAHATGLIALKRHTRRDTIHEIGLLVICSITLLGYLS